jgi:predicted permease
MSSPREWMSRVRASLRVPGHDRDLRRELEFHLEMQAESEMRRGIPPTAAERAARLRLGGLDAIQEAYRDQRGLPTLDTLLQDVRQAARSLRRDIRFAGVALLTLALGIGATTTIFSLMRGVLLEPLPYPEPERLVRVYESNPRFSLFPVGPHGLLAYRHENRTLTGIAGYVREDLQLSVDSRPERLRALRVSTTYFDVLGARPMVGRTFTWAEEREDSNVAILSDAVWRRRFNADPAVVGSAVRLSGKLFTIVGVMPPGFQHIGGSYRTTPHGETVDAWWPLALDRASERKGWHYINAVARLKPDVTPSRARDELAAVSARIHTSEDPWDIRVVSLLDDVVGRSGDAIVLLMTAVGLVMLIACANVASLMLARATARRRERAVRWALGATRARLVRQAITEAIVLAAPGAVGGAIVAIAGVHLLVSVLPQDFPRLHNVRVDPLVLAFAAGLAGLSVVLFGLLPAWHEATDAAHPMLHEGGTRTSAGSRTMRWRSVLVVSEIALASMLLVGAGLLARSFINLQSAPPGFKTAGIVSAVVSLPEARYPKGEDSERFFRNLLSEVRRLPGVASAGLGTDLPWTGYDENLGFEIIGRPTPEEPSARFHVAAPGYFETLGIRLEAGRLFSDRDAADAPKVLIVNAALAARYFPGETALNHVLDVFGAKRTIVGVVGDVKDSPTEPATVPALWWPHGQMPFTGMTLVARAGVGDPMGLLGDIRRAVQRLDPDLPLADVHTLDDIAAAANAQRRFVLVLTALFAAAALLLAAVGAYGVLAWTVRQRTRELGIRVALGADRRSVLLLVLGQGLRLAVLGLTIGCVAAVASGGLLRALLFGVSPRDAGTFAAAALTMLLISALAAFFPALSATRASPVEALRLE